MAFRGFIASCSSIAGRKQSAQPHSTIDIHRSGHHLNGQILGIKFLEVLNNAVVMLSLKAPNVNFVFEWLNGYNTTEIQPTIALA